MNAIARGLAAFVLVPSGGAAFADFLLGNFNNSEGQVGAPIADFRSNYFALYAQDSWRLGSNVTMNYGLRWEAELPRREINDKMNSFDPTAINPVSGTPGVVTFAGVNGTPSPHRIGVKWSSPKVFSISAIVMNVDAWRTWSCLRPQYGG